VLYSEQAGWGNTTRFLSCQLNLENDGYSHNIQLNCKLHSQHEWYNLSGGPYRLVGARWINREG
jgi:hypothetical protein